MSKAHVDDDEAIARAMSQEDEEEKPQSLWERPMNWLSQTARALTSGITTPQPTQTSLDFEDADSVSILPPQPAVTTATTPAVPGSSADAPIILNDDETMATLAQQQEDERAAEALSRPPARRAHPVTPKDDVAAPRVLSLFQGSPVSSISSRPAPRRSSRRRAPSDDDNDDLMLIDTPNDVVQPPPAVDSTADDERLARELQQAEDAQFRAQARPERGRATRATAPPRTGPTGSTRQQDRDARLAAALQEREYLREEHFLGHPGLPGQHPIDFAPPVLHYPPVGLFRRFRGYDLPGQDRHGDIDLSTYEGRLRLDEGAVKVGLTTQQLSLLPQSKFVPNAGGGDKDCNVCLMEFEAGETVTSLPCLHKFHTDCISKWLRDNKICPICRLEVKV